MSGSGGSPVTVGGLWYFFNVIVKKDRAHRMPVNSPARTRVKARTSRVRVLLLALGGLSMLTGLNAALVRLDVWAPVPSQRAGDVHGLLMVLGFLGTLIALERAQALGRLWGYVAPALLGGGALLLLSPLPPLLGHLLLIEGCAVFGGIYVAVWRRLPQPLIAVQILSAVLALGGAILSLVVGIPAGVPWFIGFIVLTIASERAELAALSMGESAARRLVGVSVAMAASILVATLFPAVGDRLLGVVLVITAVWLLRRDVAGRQMRMKGQQRFIGTALFAGYLQLALAGIVLGAAGLTASPGTYDVAVHAVFLGFAVSMVMAHAPVILPAVIGRPLPYGPALWVPLCLLHGGLLVRYVGAGLSAWRLADWRVGGVITVVALLVFVVTAVSLVATARKAG